MSDFKVGFKNDRLLRALRCQPVDRTPVWIMRQAGRYLPEYRATRARAGRFMDLCKNPELACEVTLQPLERFPVLDAGIVFSDILTIPDAMGLDLSFETGEGPVFGNPVRDIRAIRALPIPDPHRDLGYVMDAITLIKQALNQRIPLIGFSGSPWTIATYMVEGGSSKTFGHIKGLLYEDPAAMHQLLEKLIQAIVLYLKAQIQAGSDVIMIFDTWGGVLSPQCYLEFSLSPMRQIVHALRAYQPEVPVILFTKQAGSHLEGLAETGCAAVGIDWTQDLADARVRVGARVALQGNLDPAVLYASPPVITAAVHQILNVYQGAPGHIFNLGHGIYPDIPIAHVEACLNAVKEYQSNR
jgi:uroporphyrinogen decarboxylase